MDFTLYKKFLLLLFSAQDWRPRRRRINKGSLGLGSNPGPGRAASEVRQFRLPHIASREVKPKIIFLALEC